MRNGKIDRLSDFDAHGLNALWLWLQSQLPQAAPFKRQDGGGGGGGGGTVVNELEVCWGGQLPTVLGNGTTWPVPYEADGTSKTYSMTYLKARIETVHTAVLTFRVEKSAGGGIFSASDDQTITIAISTYEKILQAPGDFTAISVSSGDLLRLVFVAVGSDADFSVTFVGEE